MASNYSDDFRKYAQDKVSVKQLDDIMAFVMNSGGGKLGAIIAGAKILICAAYLFARWRINETDRLILRQNFEQAVSNNHQNQNEV